MVAVAYHFSHLPIRCGVLCKRKEVRVKFGCDKPASPAGYSIYCWECWGLGSDDSGPCTTCHGSGQIELDRCPAAFIGPGENAILRAYQFYRRGHWPAAGTWRNQAQPFLKLIPLLDGAWSAHMSLDAAKKD